MNIKAVKDCVSSLSVLLIVFDILLVLFNGYYFWANRGIFLFIIFPIIQIFNIKYKNIFANSLLFLYEFFLMICNILSFTFLFYESSIAEFAVNIGDIVDISNFLNLSDDIYLCVLLFFQPLTVSFFILMLVLIVKAIKKVNSGDGSLCCK